MSRMVPSKIVWRHLRLRCLLPLSVVDMACLRFLLAGMITTRPADLVEPGTSCEVPESELRVGVTGGVFFSAASAATDGSFWGIGADGGNGESGRPFSEWRRSVEATLAGRCVLLDPAVFLSSSCGCRRNGRINYPIVMYSCENVSERSLFIDLLKRLYKCVYLCQML